MSTGRLAAWCAVLMLLAGCGTDAAPAADSGPSTTTASVTTVSSSTTTTLPADEVLRCDDVPRLYASPDDYAAMPMYFADEMPADAIRNWAAFRPGFEGIWIDREHNGWITVAFSEEAAASRSDLAALFPGVGAVVVEVDWTRVELDALRDRATATLREVLSNFGIGVGIQRGMVEVSVGPLTTEILAFVEENFGGERICVDGIDPAILPPPGPQPTFGAGWRLLADEPHVGQPYRTGIATDAASLLALWESVGLRSPVPEVDFTSEVVIWFGAVFSGSCPEIRLDDVVVDGGLVYAEIVHTGSATFCTDDANPRAYVVALARDRLPPGPFAIQLGDRDPPPTTLERTEVDADLSRPGAVADPSHISNQPFDPGPQRLRSGDIVEPGFPADYLLDARCGITWLGDLNFYSWRTDAAVPPEWEALMSEEGSIVVSVMLRLDPGTIEATAGGVAVTYLPTNDPLPVCP